MSAPSPSVEVQTATAEVDLPSPRPRLFLKVYLAIQLIPWRKLALSIPRKQQRNRRLCVIISPNTSIEKRMCKMAKEKTIVKDDGGKAQPTVSPKTIPSPKPNNSAQNSSSGKKA
jgi:hypothetical protein